MIVEPVPTVDFEKCHPERCENGICKAISACSHKALVQEEPYDFPMHITARCTSCGLCPAACPFEAIRMI